MAIILGINEVAIRHVTEVASFLGLTALYAFLPFIEYGRPRVVDADDEVNGFRDLFVVVVIVVVT
jgi:hypothetical protein